jgi:hypothetical protein
VQIFGEVSFTPYMVRDSAYIYALNYVDRFLGINIIDIIYSLYFQMIDGHEVNNTRF